MTEEKIKSLLNRYVALEELAKALEERLNILLRVRDELSSTLVFLNDLLKVEEGREVLVPLGSLAYAKAKVTDVSKVVVGVGANVFLEKGVNEAIKYFENKRNVLDTEINTLVNELNRVNSQLSELRAVLESYSRGAR